MPRQIYGSLFERLVANSSGPPEGQNENGCWLWSGNTDSKGYGRLALRMPGRKNPTGVRAHRAMEQHLRAQDALREADFAAQDPFGPLHDDGDLLADMDPDEETIEHLCGNEGCVNPDHWVTLTRAMNTIAMYERRAKL